MKFFAVAALFAASALAIPHAPSSTEIEQSQSSCGKAQLSCCNELDNGTVVSAEEESSLLDLLGNSDVLSDGVLGKYRGCGALASLQGTVGGQCNNHVACCDVGDTDTSGLVGVAIPCLPLNLL
ncbi:hydrophobin family protein [Aspergillus lucknowensis]|uniref:Hydrophobin n=1 Tax=Aspergillus lucknowensis TaxID=176173 RepID=A0ABR4LIY6_9EURO